MVGAGSSVGKAYLGLSYGEDLVGGNGVKIRGSVGEIAVQGALYVLPKAPSPIEVTNFDWVAWRVGVVTLMETC